MFGSNYFNDLCKDVYFFFWSSKNICVVVVFKFNISLYFIKDKGVMGIGICFNWGYLSIECDNVFIWWNID